MENNGTCMFCSQMFGKNGITRHLKSCSARKEQIEVNRIKSPKVKNQYFHLVIEDADDKRYWLHLLIDERATVELLDDILRGIWLECCGHLSNFIIEWNRFESDMEETEDLDDVYSMKVQLHKVLVPKQSFSYSYDYGSTTRLSLRVLDLIIDLPLDQAAYLMARNVAFAKGKDNSPRHDVCGYEEDKHFDIAVFNLENYLEDDSFDLNDTFEEWEDDAEDLDFSGLFPSLSEDEHRDFLEDLTYSKKKILQAQRIYEPIEPCSLETALSRLTKEELLKIAKFHSVKAVSQMNKAQIITTLVDELPTIIRANTAYLTTEQLDMYKTLIANEGVVLDEDLNTVRDDYSAIINHCRCYLVFTGGRKTQGLDELVCMLPHEIKAALTDLDMCQLSAVAKRNDLLVKLTLGLLYYYGVMTLEVCISELERLTKAPLDPLDFEHVMRLFNYNDDQFQRQGNYLIYYFSEAYENILHEQNKRPQLQYKRFTKQQLIAASDFDFYQSTPAVERFKSLIKGTFDIDREDLEFLVGDILDMLDDGDTMHEIMAWFTNSFEMADINMANIYVHAISEISNHHRQWALKGHFPQELYEKDDRPALRPLTNGPFQTSNIIDLTTRKKIGRNDLCPCGSGRKFKHCCGIY